MKQSQLAKRANQTRKFFERGRNYKIYICLVLASEWQASAQRPGAYPVYTYLYICVDYSVLSLFLSCSLQVKATNSQLIATGAFLHLHDIARVRTAC